MPTARTADSSRLVWWIAFAVACVIQLVGLYFPDPPGGGGGSGLDKVAHALMFGLVMTTGALAGLPALVLAAVLAVHAVLSEFIQALVLPHRSGDVWDVVADLVGVGLGYGLVVAVSRLRSAPPIRHLARSRDTPDWVYGINR